MPDRQPLILRIKKLSVAESHQALFDLALWHPALVADGG